MLHLTISCVPIVADLYFEFNRSMRLKANKMGYSLNQRGLYSGVIRNPSDTRQKLNDGESYHLIMPHTSDPLEGVIVASETEQEIFAQLGVSSTILTIYTGRLN